jgi:hAT family C-terminal dimerisation region
MPWYVPFAFLSAIYLLTILSVLDPIVKDLYCRHRWEMDQFNAGMRRLGEVVRDILDIIFNHRLMECHKFDKYYTPPAIPTASKSVTAQSEGMQNFLTCLQTYTNTQLGEVDVNSTADVRYGGSYLLEAVQSFRQEAKAAGNPRDELKLYLESGPEVTSDVVGWWGHQDSRYPTLMRMACDYLAIQGSATPSEHAFSSGGITDTARRNRLSPKLFEALQILKSAYCNGHITAPHQAAQHVDVLIALQEELETPTDDKLED